MKSPMFYVCGGYFIDVDTVDRNQYRVMGPFDAKVAHDVWREVSFAYIDDSTTRFEIVPMDDLLLWKQRRGVG